MPAIKEILKMKHKNKETITISNFQDCDSWKHMLEYLKNNKNSQSELKDVFHYSIQMIKNGIEKKVPLLIVFLHSYEVYHDIIHAKLYVLIIFFNIFIDIFLGYIRGN